MMRYFVSVLCALMIVGATQFGHTRDADGTYTIIGDDSCGEYLDAHSRATLDDDGYKGPHKFWRVAGWITGYITGYNRWAANGKKNITAGLSRSDVYRWIASWCRDNPSKDLNDATEAFVLSRDQLRGAL